MTAKIEHTDFPFDEVVAKIQNLAASGAYCYQKFTCAGCGNRLTIDEPNVMYETGTCDNCPTVTNIKQRGCNFMLYMGPNPPGVKR
jgi:hypothetical protein